MPLKHSSSGWTGRRDSQTLLTEPLERRVLLSGVITVTSIADSGAGTLRNAIIAANTDTNTLTTIRFQLPGSGVQTILPTTALPAITSQVDIQGTTDAGGDPLVELDGSQAGAGVVGLNFDRASSSNTKPSTVSGLVIDRFHGNGIDISGTSPTDVFGCRIGTDATGEHAHPNSGDGIFVNTPACQIGLVGKGPALQNLISGNGVNGVESGAQGADCTIVNCLIGTDAKGTSARPNSNDGVLIGVAFATIGGRRAHSGNVISGNGQNGLEINFGNDEILGNLIGTNAAGTALLANNTSGISAVSIVNLSIGDSTDAGRNLICAGAGSVGIGISNVSQSTINNNLIGTDITGDQVLNEQFTIDGQLVTEEGLDGVQAFESGANVVLENCIIGGFDNGVETNDVSGLTVLSCHIGISADLKHALPNHGDGIEFFESSGCTAESNIIANSSEAGVNVADDSSVGDRIIQNSIFSNTGLGINLGGDDTDTPLPNHAGNVAKPNHDQNYPALSSAVEHDNATFITGTLSTTANTDMLVEFFASDVADPSGFGEGQTEIGSTGVTTDAQGNGSFTNFQADAVKFGQVITATAVNTGSANSTNGDTSEFSQAIAVTGTTISGNVFNDANGNGKRDAGETPLRSRTVYVDVSDDGLFDSGSDPSATTDAHGNYSIFVPTGSNRVRLLQTAGFQQTSPSPKAAFHDVSVASLATAAGVNFSQEESTATPARLAIDAGSATPYIDLSGQTFAAGPTHVQEVINFPVAGTDDDPLYVFADAGSTLNYSYAVPNGKYTLKLFFVDGSMGVGQRTFNVFADGTELLKHFDIFATAGAAFTAVTKSVPLTITNKTLTLQFKGVVGNAVVSAFELIPA
jgi:hypothetical protein